MQHANEGEIWFDDDEWTFEKGLICTYDREFGIGNMISIILHRVTDTHVAHHLSPSVPHYYAKKVTEILQREMGADYRRMPRCRSYLMEFLRECRSWKNQWGCMDDYKT